jgi:catechol 2,3-dioxygenase-like lactoylglutathione lyase family enzyme
MKVACSLRHECLPSGDALGTIAAGIMRAVSATSSPVARACAFFGSYCVDTLGLERVIFGADNLDEPKRFFTDWGLQRVSTTRSRVAFATRNGSQLQVWRDDAGGLAPRVGPDGQFREFVLAMKTQRDVDRVGDDIARDRAVEQQPDGRLRFQDDAGITLSVIVSTRGRVDPPKAQAFNQPGNRGRVNAIANVHTQAAPWQIGHIVFFVPDVNEAEAFYRKRLGFWLSDRYVGGAGVFLRWARRSEHHNMFLLKSPHGRTALHHLAFEVQSPHEVFGGGLAFSGKGWATQVGPGRHPISSAYFWYFRNPLGGAVEYYCDPDFVTEDWKPHHYRVNRFSEWHLTEGIPPPPADPNRPSLAAARSIEAARGERRS